MKSKLQIQEVSNGLSGEEFLKYKMDVTENGGVRTTTVVIIGSFVALNGASENTALSEFFPTMWPGQSVNAASSVFTQVTFPFSISVGGIDSAPTTDTFIISDPAPATLIQSQ